MQRFAYNCLSYLAAPLFAGRLLWGGLGDRRYWRRWPERFGWPPAPWPKEQAVLWAHTVSVGELHTAAPLLRRLAKSYPDYRTLVTTVTPTGAERVPAELGTCARHLYLPYDLPSAVQRFLARTRPRLGLVLETELWPELFLACEQRGIPLCLINARLSQRSADRYRKIARLMRLTSLMRRTLGALSLVAARSDADAQRLIALGADPTVVHVSGNLKYDVELPASVHTQGHKLRTELFAPGPLWVAASTHRGEEEAVLRAHAQVVRAFPQAQLVLAPRHPRRGAEVRKLCRRLGRATVTRTSGLSCTGGGVLLLDTLGELPYFYAAADAAFIGGSLVPHGGHNLLEPAALGRPVLTGPHLHNFQEVADMLCSGGGACIVPGKEDLGAAVLGLLRHKEEATARGKRAAQVVAANRGAVARVAELVQKQLRAI